ncbi:MAG TPA: response regulator [Anaerolineae bacterium]|nr:response regulator [Anaerolineae bacterium]
MTKRILVVEDDNSLSMLLRLIMKFRQEEWLLSSASNGLEALTQVEKFQPDLVLLDIMMPEMDGLEFARRVRADARWSNMTIVVLSALSDPNTRRKARDIGVQEYWTKPITPDELQAGLQRVLGEELPDVP